MSGRNWNKTIWQKNEPKFCRRGPLLDHSLAHRLSMHRMHGWQPLELRRWLFGKHTQTRRIFKNCKLVTPKLFSFYPFHFFVRLLFVHDCCQNTPRCLGWFRARNRRVHWHDVVRVDGSVRVYSPSSGPVKIQYFNILAPNLCLPMPITHNPCTKYQLLFKETYYSQPPQKHVQQRPTVESSTWVMQRRMAKTGSRVYCQLCLVVGARRFFCPRPSIPRDNLFPLRFGDARKDCGLLLSTNCDIWLAHP